MKAIIFTVINMGGFCGYSSRFKCALTGTSCGKSGTIRNKF